MINGTNMFLNFSVILLAFEPAVSKTNSHSPTVYAFPLVKTACMPEKFF